VVKEVVLAIDIPPRERKRMVTSIRSFFAEEMEEQIGDLRAGLLLDFCLEEICPTVYNRAMADAQAWLLGRVEDLDGSLFEPEFGYWRR
jgi:uncharacterized protein (DUF2164 family)